MRQARQRGVQLEPPSTHLFLRGGLRSTFSHSKVASAAWPFFGCPRTSPGESLLPLGLGLGIISLREPARGGPSRWGCGEEVAAPARRKLMSFAKVRWAEAEVARVTGQPQGPQKDKGGGGRPAEISPGDPVPKCCSFDGAASPAVLPSRRGSLPIGHRPLSHLHRLL